MYLVLIVADQFPLFSFIAPLVSLCILNMAGKPPKRAAATSAKAQHVAAIADAEAKEAVPAKKLRGRPKKNPVKPVPVVLEEEEEEELEHEADDAAASGQKGPIDVIIECVLTPQIALDSESLTCS